ncbi:hypothetical protein F4805DRAFT_453061 [Annulohypoxylon moriforme]|nr:hypothetical protein F4805DRAFT_453061 [Annulohypoxylon moriforme]
MGLESFHLFPRLPLELRRVIYLLATPPRIVHIERKKEQWKDRKALFNDVDLEKVKLPRILSYFDDHFNQLVSYYLHDSTSSYIVPIPAILEQGIDWVDCLDSFLRNARFYSEAPIPALLHTCAESRMILISAGYQLTFGARDHEPMTWFHFENDILSLTSLGISHGRVDVNLADYMKSSIGKIDVESLQKVRNVVGFQDVSWGVVCVGCVARFFPKLENLYVTRATEVDMYNMDGTLLPLFWKFSMPGNQIANAEHNFSRRRKLLQAAPTGPIDVLLFFLYCHMRRLYDIPCFDIMRQKMSDVENLSLLDIESFINQQAQWLNATRDKLIKGYKEYIYLWQTSMVEYVFEDRNNYGRATIQDSILQDFTSHRPGSWEILDFNKHESWRMTGSTVQISKTKIEPLESEIKHNSPYDGSDRGSAGSSRTIDQTRIQPLGGKSQHQHTAPHADSHGVVGTVEDIGKVRIPPLESDSHEAQNPRTGLDDEVIDAARIDPLGSVREY